ncbi:hypothetical protein ACHAXT_000657 [Thalassiosira profunda]
MNYDEIIHEDNAAGGSASLKSRLVRFRKWATKQAGITVHPALCIVNSEATDGTRNAPVLIFESRPDPRARDGQGAGTGTPSTPEARCGAVDNAADGAMYDRSIGCQVRTVRELKGEEMALSVPKSAMITPDLIAESDAGKAVRACCGLPDNDNFWDAFGPTMGLEKAQAMKTANNTGTQLLIKILQERKKAEAAISRAERVAAEGGTESKLAHPGQISRRAPYLAFLIHQRFANKRDPAVTTDKKSPLFAGEAPKTFAPYARTLPSSICLPICWRRSELALLAGCIPGMPALQRVAARTMHLAAELIALVEAGLLTKFPSGFSPGVITWDRWVWACAAYESRMIPAASLPAWVREGTTSPPVVWEQCGVMVPLLDMLNHEDEAAQAQWSRSDDTEAGRLTVMTSEKTKKHMQVYRNYGLFDNEYFMLQFGFTRMSNPADRLRIAWALVDGVGGVAPPPDYEPVSESASVHPSRLVFDSTNAEALTSWWTEPRIALLGKATLNNDETLELLRKGKKITFCAFNNGKIDPVLIAVAVAATLAPEKVADMHRKGTSNPNRPLEGLVLNKSDQSCVRLYLSFLFAKKLGKLLQNLNSCLKDHFNSVQLWTKASQGGLNYAGEGSSGSVDGEGATVMGWQTFFDTYAWYSTMEVEERYYAMAPDSCVLTLYDGHVKSLQGSLDIMTTDEVFIENVGRQLEELGCTLNGAVVVAPASTAAVTPATAQSENGSDGLVVLKSGAEESKGQKGGDGNGEGSSSTQQKGTKRRGRPPAIKLHIGNLSYKTLPNELYDFFSKMYGAEAVLECHIPTERDSGLSRGFGFVTMPEHLAKRALDPESKHEMDGRVLKVAESNSAGSGGRRSSAPAQNDRCPNCGYRPKWCTCGPSGVMPMDMGGPPPQDNPYGPGPHGMGPPMDSPGYGPNDMGMHDRRMDDRPMGGDEYGGWGGDRGGGGWDEWRRSRSRSPSYRRSDRDWDRERGRGGYRRSRSYSRSRSRSYDRDRRERDRHRHRHGDRRHRDDDGRRGRYDDERGRDRGGGRSRRKSRSRSRGRGGPGSPGAFSDRPEGGGGERGGRSPASRSRSPAEGNGAMDRPKKKESRRSRSRDRGSGSGGRSGRRKRSKGSRRDKGSSSKRRGGSRSRSRDRH